jgi:hypothetical protein
MAVAFGPWITGRRIFLAIASELETFSLAHV